MSNKKSHSTKKRFSLKGIRVTGISLPLGLGGITWEYKDSEEEANAEIAKRLVTFLEDRRVVRINNPHVHRRETEPYAIKSIMEIRERLVEDLSKIDRNSELAENIRGMQKACREFLDKVGPPGDFGNQFAFNKLSSDFAVYLLNIGAIYGFSIEVPSIETIEGEKDKPEGWINAYHYGFWDDRTRRLVAPDKGKDE